MRAAVITFPASNCDEDCVYALQKSGFVVDRLWHKKPVPLQDYKLVVLPGGFSYGDYLRCGAIASLSPIVEEVRRFAEGGGYVIGICNGFQILCETKLLPGALVRNEKQRFVCKDIELEVVERNTPWTNALPDRPITLPIAHGDGRYYADDATLAQLKEKKRIAFRYRGENPNGSADAIAGITNERGNVLGMMPHPDRAVDLRGKDGALLWGSIRRWLEEKTRN